MDMKTSTAIFALLVILAATSCLADPPAYEDQDLLGLEISGELLAPPALVAQIAQDLASIRMSYPEIEDIHARSDWVPGRIWVGLTDEAWADFEAGIDTEIDALNAEYGPCDIQPYASISALILEFTQCYHPVVLGDIYEQASGVRYASISTVYGDGDDISAEQLGYYVFKRGWGDCASSCTYADYWEFSVDAGTAELRARYGTSFPPMDVRPVELSATLESNVPNPFNPSTTLRYRLETDAWVRLRIYDVQGNLVKELQDRFMSAGDQAVRWNATDRSGVHVASGVYLTELVVDGVAQTRKIALTK